jgi:magnesium chelatase family protein
MTTRPDRPGSSGGLVSVASAAVAGVSGYPVTVDVHSALGLPGFTVVGAPDATYRETRDRVRAAIISSGFHWPATRITVDVGPPGTTRRMSSLDTAIAVGILAADGQVNRENIEDHSFISELGLDGTLRSLPAGISLVEAVTTRRVVVAPAMVTEARLAGRVVVQTGHDLRSVADALNGRRPWPDTPAPPDITPSDTPPHRDLLAGPPALRAAVAIAAAGGHNLLLIGPHDTAPESTARQVAALVPDLTDTEALGVSRVYSAAGHPLPVGGLIRRPPLRYPRTPLSTVALVGGASRNVRPGEISLAHNGLLLLDDLTLYPRAVLDTLTLPLDEGAIRVARAATQVSLPARFQLIAAVPPCGCGARAEDCACSEVARARHAARVSRALFDRFDLRVAPAQSVCVPSVPLGGGTAMADRIQTARTLATGRGVRTNAELLAAQLFEDALLDPSAWGLIEQELWTGRLTDRGVVGVWRVALTIADLRGDEPPLTHLHVAAALALRPPMRRRSAQ